MYNSIKASKTKKGTNVFSMHNNKKNNNNNNDNKRKI